MPINSDELRALLFGRLVEITETVNRRDVVESVAQLLEELEREKKIVFLFESSGESRSPANDSRVSFTRIVD